MAVSPEQIDLWLQADRETQNLEFKRAEQSFGFDKACEYAVAIANEGGGHLLLGVTDKKPRLVVGSVAFRDPIKTAMDLFNKVGFRVDVEEVLHPDGRVVVLMIPSRPAGTAYHLDGRYLMRSGEGLTSMSEDRLRAIFAEGRPDWLEEASLTDLSVQQVVDLLDTQKFFELLKLPLPSTTQAIVEKLVSERLVDADHGAYQIRRIGGLLLCRRLEDFPDLSRKAARVVVYDGESKAKTTRDQTGVKGYAVGFQSLVGFVMSQLPQNEVLQDALRVESPLVPEIAIRELVANALIHQDFAFTGGAVMIEVYSNRVEISNPGEPIVPVDRFIDGYQSRNERLADLMRRFGICEEKSSGIDHVIRTAEVMQLPPPSFEVGHRRTVSVVFGPKPFEQMHRAERVRACYQHCSLRHITRQETSNSSLRERFKLGKEKSTAVSQILSATVEDGLIKLDQSAGGSRSQTRYLPFWA